MTRSSGPDNVFVVGDDGTILHFDGTVWTVMVSGTQCPKLLISSICIYTIDFLNYLNSRLVLADQQCDSFLSAQADLFFPHDCPP
jgi:hypothetical protein